jgi:hypothetical protein
MDTFFTKSLLVPLLTGLYLLLSAGTAQALGPQPEPPDKYRKGLHKKQLKHKLKRHRPRPGEKRSINPQPEPPGKSLKKKIRKKRKHGFVKPGSKRGFNPQPEPPAQPGQQKGMQH